jgi:membrane fusion protein (multidrug efflux system)
VRYLVVVLGLFAILGGLAAIKYKQIAQLLGFGEKMMKMGPPPEAVGTAPAQTQDWVGTLVATGSISAAKGVTVSNDAPGVVAAIRFDSGDVVKQGQILLELDSSVERANLSSAIARRDLAQVNTDRSKVLFGKDAIAKSDVDTNEATLRSAIADVGALQAQIDRKIVRAPFAGKLGIRAVNLGQYLNPGTMITVLQAVEAVYADFTLPQQKLEIVKVGMPVKVQTDAGAVLDGTIAAVDPTLDTATRTLRVRAALPNQSEKLRPGMYVNVAVILPGNQSVVAAPQTAVVHAPYGDSVFVVEDKDGGKVARQQFVRLGEARGDFVAILDGVTAGQELVVEGAFKLRNGARLMINNDHKINPQAAPHPENR